MPRYQALLELQSRWERPAYDGGILEYAQVGDGEGRDDVEGDAAVVQKSDSADSQARRGTAPEAKRRIGFRTEGCVVGLWEEYLGNVFRAGDGLYDTGALVLRAAVDLVEGPALAGGEVAAVHVRVPAVPERPVYMIYYKSLILPASQRSFL